MFNIYFLMLLLSLLLIPLIGIFIIITNLHSLFISLYSNYYLKLTKSIALSASIINFIVSLLIFIFFDFSYNQFQYLYNTQSSHQYPNSRFNWTAHADNTLQYIAPSFI